MLIRYYKEKNQIVKTTIGFKVPKIITITQVDYINEPVKGKIGVFIKLKKMYNTGKVQWVGLTRYVQLQDIK